MNPAEPQPDGDGPEDRTDQPSTPKEESLAERSARLETEAMNMGVPDPLAPEPLPQEISEDPPEQNEGQSEKISVLEEELDKAKDQMMRAVAEAENTRRLARKEREDAKKFGISGFARDLVDVADNLRRALEAVPEDLLETEPRLKNLVEGIEATERELLRSFEKNGVEKIEPIDEPFDPNFHEVMFEAPGTGKQPGIIVQVIEVGYVLNGRILRPARVAVAKDDGQGGGGEPPPAEPGSQIDTEA